MKTPAACCAPLASPVLTVKQAEATAALFKSLGDPHRVRIVNLLASADRAVCVCEMTGPLGIAQPTVSHHLKKLVDAGLLVRERRGTWSYYALDAEAARRLAETANLGEDMSMPETSTPTTDDKTDLVEEVRARYAALAIDAGNGCCGPDACTTDVDEVFGAGLYEDGDRAALPDAAQLASLGCGNPVAVAALREGEVVLDLGSGGGIDVLLSAQRVGPTGKVYGLDMTEEMLALARRNAAEAGATNVEFLRGRIEDVPLPAATVDVVISNCVVNLSTDKPAVLAELYRVLVPGGRIGISDVVADDRLSPAERAERGSHVDCIAGALSFAEYRDGLAAAGFVDVTVEATHQVTDGLHGAIVRAAKPA